MRQIFVTGGSGFIGKTLLNRLANSPGDRIKVLSREIQDSSTEGSVEFVVGDLLKPDSYQDSLKGCDLIIHLAAATGRAAPSEHHAVNVQGTQSLLQACKAAGVSRLIHVSSIAAGYANQRFYPYAQTKAEAESLVAKSGLDHVILRPTIVLGTSSPIWKTLVKVASLPSIPLPESRPVHVQPIHVDDVVRGLERLLTRERFAGELLELGGPRPIPMSEFLLLIQHALRGASGRIIRLPLAPIRLGLAAIEPVLRPLMPVTAGQLAIFANDSVPAENWLLAELRRDMPSTEETVARLAAFEVGRANQRQ